MKNKAVLCALLFVAILPWTNARAVILFDENFDGEPYHNNTAFNDPLFPVTGVNKLNYGYWSINNAGAAVVSASTATSLSSTRSMALTSNAAGEQAQVVGNLGVNGSAGTTTTEALVIKFAFNLQDVTRMSLFLMRDGNGANLGYLTLGGATSEVKAIFGSGSSSLGTVSNNTWYTMEMIMSANPGNGTNIYSASLYNSDGSSQIGTATGTFAAVSTAKNYRYFTAYNQGYAGQTVPLTTYFDNISVQTIPEPSGLAYIMLGGLGLLLLQKYRRAGRSVVSSR